uniref:7TM GPCR serpentine receptor class x (Srx) domain-containing protein n=1 Tax=Panagrolaimus sp. JU765 TaxID=591449 RepID=A0AC34QGJ7_9BILA
MGVESVIGLSLDVVVTVVCVICYFLIYIKLRKLNNASCCLLSERALYRRRQKEFKLAAEFCFSCIIYVANWIVIRLIKPELRLNINFTVMACLLYFQLFHAAVMAGISILFVNEFRTALKKVWKSTVHIRKLSSTVVPASNHTKEVNPLKVSTHLPCR